MIYQKKNTHMVNVYDNTIPDKICRDLILLFEKNTEEQEYVDKDHCPCFTQMNLNRLSNGIVKLLTPIVQQVYYQYKIDTKSKYIPQFKKLEDDGFGSYPVCMAKTQYSFSTDPLLMGAPTGHEVPIREVRLSAGAEFVVVVCGEIMTMPGLPRVPAAEAIGLDENNEIAGLF